MRLKVGCRYVCSIPDGGVFRVLAEYGAKGMWYWLLEEGKTGNLSELSTVLSESQVDNFVPFNKELVINWGHIPSGYNELHVEKYNCSEATNSAGDVWRINDAIMDVIAPDWRLFCSCKYLKVNVKEEAVKEEPGEPTTSILGSIKAVVDSTPELSDAITNGLLYGSYFGITGIFHIKGEDTLVIGYHLGSKSADGDTIETRLLRIFEHSGIAKVGKNSYSISIPSGYSKDTVRGYVCDMLKQHGAEILNEKEGSFGIITGDAGNEEVRSFEEMIGDSFSAAKDKLTLPQPLGE